MSDRIECYKNIILEQRDLTNKYEITDVIGFGQFGIAYRTKQGKVIKISEISDRNSYKKKINLILNLLGDGFAKSIKYKKVVFNNKGYLIEVSKERLMDLKKVINYKYGKTEEDKKTKIEQNENKIESVKNFSPLAAMIQLTNSLEKMHLVGFIHADLKLDNVLITENGVCKLSDFGLTDDVDYYKNNTDNSNNFEIERNKLKDGYLREKTDVCALGVMFSRMLSGKPTIINIDDIKLDKFYPNIDFSMQPEIEREIKERLFNLIQSMTQKDPKNRITIFEVKEKLANLTRYMGENLKNKSDEPVNFKKDLKIREKDLYGLGIIEGVNLDDIRKKYKEEIDLLIEYSDKTPNKRKEEKEKNIHLKTILGDEIDNFSAEARDCLISLRACIGKNEIIISEDFKNKFETLKSKENRREISIVAKRLLDLEKLRLAKQGNRIEEFRIKSLVSIIEENPERMVDLLDLFKLNYREKIILNKNKDSWKIILFDKAFINGNGFALNLLYNNEETKNTVMEKINEDNDIAPKCFSIICNYGNYKFAKEIINTNKLQDIDIVKNCLLLICKGEKIDIVKELLSYCKNKIVVNEGNNNSRENESIDLFRILLKEINEKIESKEEKENLIKECFKESVINNKNSDVAKILFDEIDYIKEDKKLMKEIFKFCCEHEYLLFVKELIKNSIIDEEIIKKKFRQYYCNFGNNRKRSELFNILFNTDCIKNDKNIMGVFLGIAINESPADINLIKKVLENKLSKSDIAYDTSYTTDIRIFKILIEKLDKDDLDRNYTASFGGEFNALDDILEEKNIEKIQILIDNKKIDLDSEQRIDDIINIIFDINEEEDTEEKDYLQLTESLINNVKEEQQENIIYKIISKAIEKNKSEFINILLSRLVKIAEENKEKLLINAIDSNNTEVAKVLIKNGFRFDEKKLENDRKKINEEQFNNIKTFLITIAEQHKIDLERFNKIKLRTFDKNKKNYTYIEKEDFEELNNLLEVISKKEIDKEHNI